MNKRYALCIGNNYPGTSAELNGCVNDALDWAELLALQGYEYIRIEREADKATTLDCLRRLVEQAGFGDRIVFTYSGHGTWIPDRNGDESDGRDEALVMADYAQGGLITDDELQAIFGELRRGAAALILSDSCHSGTVSRLIGTMAADTLMAPRFLSPANFTDLTDEEVTRRELVAASAPRPTASLISGCGDLEYSYDASFAGRPNGAFSRVAIDAYEPGISLSAWHRAIRAVLPTGFYPQSPELTAASSYRRYLRAL